MTIDYAAYRPLTKLSITKDGSQIEHVIRVRATTEITALEADNVPAYGSAATFGIGLMYCNRVSVAHVENSAGDDSDKYLFDVTAIYETLDNTPVSGKARWSVNGLNQSIKRRAVNEAADKTDYLYGDSEDEGYTGLGINVEDKGAEGVDVDDPYEVLRIDMWVAPALTAAKLAAIRALRNQVNDDDFSGPWGTYSAGEARLHTYQVSHVNGELDQISVEFLCLDNVQFDVTLWDGTEHENVTKNGHQYYWQRMRKVTSDTDDTKAEVNIIDAHVDTLYQSGDFSGLGITNSMFDYDPGS